MHDWIVSALAGDLLKKPLAESTFTHNTSLYLLNRQEWNSELLTALGVSVTNMPQIPDAGAVIGPARGRGLDGVPICIGMGDNQAAFVGSVSDTRGSELINVGTGGQVAALSMRNRESASLPHAAAPASSPLSPDSNRDASGPTCAW